MNQEMIDAMKASGLPTAATPELDPNNPLSNPEFRALAEEARALHAKNNPPPQAGGAEVTRLCTRTHLVLKGKKQVFVVRKEGNKKYITKNKTKIFLADIKGKYTYV